MKQMDVLGFYIATLHQMLGHDKAAAVLGQAPYNKNACILCLYEKGEATKADVIEAVGVG